MGISPPSRFVLLIGVQNLCLLSPLQANFIEDIILLFSDLIYLFQSYRNGDDFRMSKNRTERQESVASNNINKDQISLKLEEPRNMSMEKWSLCANGPSSEQTPFQHAKEANDSNQIQPQKRQASFESQGHKAGVP